jgi:UDP-N-acetylmuramoyl-L-alanyl-D-glutamate--2,6-diaminopimelate ligase
MRLSSLLEKVKGFKALSVKTDAVITGIADNAADLKKGELFICVKGLTRDGHDFAAQAAKNGASAIIVERPVKYTGKVVVVQVKDSKAAMYAVTDAFYSYAKSAVKIYGITGTKGKTTVTYIVEAMLKQRFKNDCAVIGTIGNKIGKKIYNAENTTPSNIMIHRYIAEAAEKKIKNVIIEASSHALDQGRLKNIVFEAAAMTNVTRDHFDYHKNFKNYLAAKLKIVTENLKKGGVLAVNTDSKGARDFMREGKKKKAKIVTYSWNGSSDFKLLFYDININGMDFELLCGRKKKIFHSHLVGKHNIYNVMAAAAMLSGIVNIDDAAAAARGFKNVKGRLENVYAGEFTVLVDFAHTPDSLEKILLTLNELRTGRIITLFGAGGERDRGKRPMMGKAAEKLSDIVILTSDNPRSEDPNRIINDVMKGVKDKSKFLIIPDREIAVKKVIAIARRDDIVLLAGKGHEEYQVIGDVKVPFSDSKAALAAIKGLK